MKLVSSTFTPGFSFLPENKNMVAWILFYVCVYEWPLFLDNKVSRGRNHVSESCI